MSATSRGLFALVVLLAVLAGSCGGHQISSWSPSGSLEWEHPDAGGELGDEGDVPADAPDAEASVPTLATHGPFVVEDATTALERADRAFERGDLPTAIQGYGVAFGSGTRAQQAYALLRLGWCEMNRDRPAEAGARLEQLLALTAQPADDEERRLRSDAVHDLAVFAAARTDETTEQTLERLAGTLAGDELRRALEALAATYRASGRLEAEAAVRAHLDSIAP